MTDPTWPDHRRALAEARSWCSPRLDLTHPAASLRSAELRPRGYPGEWMYGEILPDPIDALVTHRRRLLLSSPPPDRGAGRILCVLAGLVAATDPIAWLDDLIPPCDEWRAVGDVLAEARAALASDSW